MYRIFKKFIYNKSYALKQSRLNGLGTMGSTGRAMLGKDKTKVCKEIENTSM